jgi:MFS transporter, FSR family, fosmidomycin resistance protein
MVRGAWTRFDRGAWAVLATYGLAHAAVDATCATLLMAAAASGRIPAGQVVFAFLLYNVVAFALQPAFGMLVDRWRVARPVAVLGGLLTAAGLPLSLLPGMALAGVVVAGLGNAIFHVGGGAISLRVAPGRASAPGVFVAPGAAGLAAGALLGKVGLLLWAPVAVLFALTLAMALLPIAPSAEQPVGTRARPATSVGAGIEVAVLLVLVVVGMRAFTGFAIPLPWKAQLPLLAALTAAVVLGKAIGGVLADRFGRARIGVGALAFSAPLLMLATQSPIAGVLGMFTFNITMPVTLVAVADVLPEHPGFAFGTASLAIVLGAFPVLVGWSFKLDAWLPVAVAVWGSAIALGLALHWLEHGMFTPRVASPTISEVAE